MPTILEKFAKLNSNAVEDGKHFVINVYDDESEDPKRPVMWLEASKNVKNDGVEYIYVNVVNFYDELFFKMPQNRQDSCASVVLKRFIKHYRENYDGMPVSADFQNYDLQEKFKTAVEKGIFPKESIEFSDFTNKQDYDAESKYNMKNRKLTYLINVIEQYNGQVEIDYKVTVENVLESDFLNAKLEDIFTIGKEVEQDIRFLYGRIDSSEVALNFNDFPRDWGNIDFEYDVNSNSIETPDDMEEEEEFFTYLADINNPFHLTFSSVIDSMKIITSNNETLSINDIINNAIQTTASTNKRLIRKN